MEYFEDYKVNLTPQLGKRGRFAKVSAIRPLLYP
jgi:hypothetical protein